MTVDGRSHPKGAELMFDQLRDRAPLSRSVLSDETYIVIRDLVLEHELRPGSRVNIDSLSARLGVSPTPVREALARLEADGLVVKTPLRGYWTTPLLTAREFFELTQFRVLIEQWTTEAAAANATADVHAALRAELDDARSHVGSLESGPDVFRALTEHDARFHGRIVQAAGNELIAQSFERAHQHMHFLRLYLASRDPGLANTAEADRLTARLREYERSGQVSRTIDEHTAIADALAVGDTQAAPRLMREHIERSLELFLPIAELLTAAS
jgi:DNA-binding GntR family transcriptional regulator